MSLVIFLMWAGVSCAWSKEALASLWGFVRLCALCGAGLLLWQISAQLDERHTKSLVKCATWGCVPAFLWLVVELATRGFLWKTIKGDCATNLVVYSAGSAALALFLWPLLGRLADMNKGVWGALICFSCAGGALHFLHSHAAFYGFILGGITFLGTLVMGRRIVYPMIVVVCVLGIGTPQLILRFIEPQKVEALMTRENAKLSYLHRAYIWRYVAHRVFEKPLFGWGFDAAGQKDLKLGLLWGSPKFDYNADFNEPLGGCDGEALPLHPHSAPLQIWLELGAVGALLWTLFLASLLWHLGQGSTSRWGLACLLSSFTTAYFIGATSYGAWQSWWISALFLTAGLLRVSFFQGKTRAPL